MLDIEPLLIAVTTVIFFVLLYQLNIKLYRPLLRFMDNRDMSIAKDLKNANSVSGNTDELLQKAQSNIDQAKALDNVVLKDIPSVAIFFDLDLGIITQRLIHRRTCSGCGKIYHMINNAPKKEGVCDECNGVINIKATSSNRTRFCSNKCHDFWWKKENAIKEGKTYTKITGTIRECSVCSNEFIPKSHNSRCCSKECSHESYRLKRVSKKVLI